jgi:hypothetical protein
MATLQWFVHSCIVRSFVCVFRIVRLFVSVSCFRFVYRAFTSCIVHFSYRSCEAFAHFSFVSFAFGAYCKLIRSRICTSLLYFARLHCNLIPVTSLLYFAWLHCNLIRVASLLYFVWLHCNLIPVTSLLYFVWLHCNLIGVTSLLYFAWLHCNLIGVTSLLYFARLHCNLIPVTSLYILHDCIAI